MISVVIAGRAELLRQHFDARRGAHRSRLCRDRPDWQAGFGKTVRDLEHRDRPGRVHQLEIGKDQHADHAWPLMS
jgi:hypothetical protein